ncbi:MAG TPA: sucrase ferredoxin [Marmoricola sp.]|nr:sucrase ferredoxin [Marmoricola sp.]
MTSEPSCSAASGAVAEPLLGSAPEAVGWVCLEQDGPWGAKAWTSSHLDPSVGAAVEAIAARHGVRPSLIRRPGRHADQKATGSRQVLVAHTMPGGSWLLAGTVSKPEQLLDLDWGAVAAGDQDAVRRSLPGLTAGRPQLLVCTNGRRDACCARLGRPVAAAAAARFPGRVWEVTHTSGHRFAPTTALLPSGSLHGRVLDAAPLLAAESEGRLELAGYRGRSPWPADAQVAEGHVRLTFGLTGLDELQVTAHGTEWLVSHVDGRTWTVRVSAHQDGERPESCGKASKPVTRRTVSLLA